MSLNSSRAAHDLCYVGQQAVLNLMGLRGSNGNDIEAK
jgi:hypothetical protein